MDAITSLEIERVIATAAEPQLGLITVKQARASGVRRRVLLRRARLGTLEQLFPNVFRSVAVEESPPQRWLAGCLAVGTGVLAGRCAATHYGLPVTLAAAAPVELVISDGRNIRISGISARRSTRGESTRPWFTRRVTSIEVTIVDLAAIVKPGALGRCVDHALAHRLTSVERIRAELERRSSARLGGRRALIAVLDERADGRLRHRSGTEQGVGPWLTAAGLGGWLPNQVVEVGDGRSYEVDFTWPMERTALEVSPFFTHGSKAQQTIDAMRRRHLNMAGWQVVEATDEHLVSPLAFRPIVEALRAHLGRSGLARVGAGGESGSIALLGGRS